VVSSFEAQVVVSRGTKKEVFTLLGVQIDGDFSMSVESVGVDTGIDFTITALGQVQYTSTNAIDGGTIKFRAITLTV
jgi:6-phosphofructokinase